MRLRLKTLSILLTLIFAPTAIAAAWRKQTAVPSVPQMTLEATLVNLGVSTDRVRRVLIGPNGSTYVLDAGNNRVVIFSASWTFVRQISEIGQGPGELFDPYDMAVDRAGNVYVIDSKHRVQGFSSEGKFYGGFRYKGECLAIAVNGRGEYLLSQPESGSLIAVYGPNGDYRRSIGALKTSANGQLRNVANRVHIFVTSKDDIYVSFDHLGVLQKYNDSGQLQWEQTIPGQQVEHLRDIFWSDAIDKSKSGIVLTTSYSRIPAFYVSFNLFLDESRGRLYVPLNDGSIYVADARGNAVRFLQQPPSAVDFYNSLIVDNRGRLVATSVWRGVLLITPARPA